MEVAAVRVIAAVFVVEEDGGNRALTPTRDLDKLPLGNAWSGLLYEYARSRSGPFGILLKIRQFYVSDNLIQAGLSFHDCLAARSECIRRWRPHR